MSRYLDARINITKAPAKASRYLFNFNYLEFCTHLLIFSNTRCSAVTALRIMETFPKNINIRIQDPMPLVNCHFLPNENCLQTTNEHICICVFHIFITRAVVQT